MSFSAGSRFSGRLGTAPQISVVHPIFSFLPWASANAGRAAAPAPANSVFAKLLRVRVVMRDKPSFLEVPGDSRGAAKAVSRPTLPVKLALLQSLFLTFQPRTRLYFQTYLVLPTSCFLPTPFSLSNHSLSGAK